jgi:hypothetical protein
MFLFFHDSIFAHPTFSSSTNNFAHMQTLSRMSSLSDRMNIGQVNIEFFRGWKKIKQRCISFVLGYLRMILWNFLTAISIKHRILATFNINKNSILTACMPLTVYHGKLWYKWFVTWSHAILHLGRWLLHGFLGIIKLQPRFNVCNISYLRVLFHNS